MKAYYKWFSNHLKKLKSAREELDNEYIDYADLYEMNDDQNGFEIERIIAKVERGF